MRVIYRKIRHARYLYIKRNVEKVWGARYTLGVRYLSKNTVYDSANKQLLLLLLLLLKVMLPMHVIAYIEYLSTTIENNERRCVS